MKLQFYFCAHTQLQHMTTKQGEEYS